MQLPLDANNMQTICHYSFGVGPPTFPRQQSNSLVLVVEDEITLAQTIELYLRNDGYRTERALDGERAIELFRATRPDLVLLDLGLPRLEGTEVLRMIRSESDIPVLILTARSEEVDEVLGLGLGADDYLVKPVSARRLMARVKVVLRRASARSTVGNGVLRVGPIEIDPYRVRVTVGSKELQLTPSEYKLIEHLARTPGRAVSRGELYEAALPEGDGLERAIDVHVTNLRRKLREAGVDENFIKTVRGIGYALRV